MVHAGGDLSARLIAPQIGAVTANDAAIGTNHPYPDEPPSVRDQVLADAEAAYQEVLAARRQIAALEDEFVAARVTAIEELALIRAEVEAGLAAAEAGSGNVWRWPEPWPTSPASFWLTNPLRPSTATGAGK